MMMLRYIKYILMNKIFLFLLLLVNIFGTAYGYYWYGWQLKITPVKFMVFVPDSPTASLFFCIVIIYFLRNKNAPYIEALAITSLLKYGVWAVVMNLLTLNIHGSLPFEGYLLIVSHGAMAMEGLLYASYYKIQLKHLVVAGIVLLHNDIIDYVFGMMPIYSDLTKYMDQVGYFTFWLSIFSIAIAYYLTVRRSINKSYSF